MLKDIVPDVGCTNSGLPELALERLAGSPSGSSGVPVDGSQTPVHRRCADRPSPVVTILNSDLGFGVILNPRHVLSRVGGGIHLGLA